MTGALADRLFQAAGTFFRKTATEHGLGLALGGQHTTVAYGPARAHTLFGWRGETAVAVILGIPDAWALSGRGYLLWFVQPGAEGIDLERLPAPVGMQIVDSPEDIERFTTRGLHWLERHPYAEAASSFSRECLESGQPRGAA